jgi:hypothetical protein
MSDKSKKHGRKKEVCKAYRTSQRRELNKARRLKRHLRKHPENQDKAWDCMLKLDKVLYAAQRKELGMTDFIAAYKPTSA